MAGKSTGLAGAAIVIALVFALGTGVAGAAKGGNSANAKKCQGTGYLDWVDANGNAFANPGACTSYSAKGSELQPKPTTPTAESVCESFPGWDFTDVNPSPAPGEDFWFCQTLAQPPPGNPPPGMVAGLTPFCPPGPAGIVFSNVAVFCVQPSPQ